MRLSLRIILSSVATFALNVAHFMTNFELQLQEATKFLLFLFSLLEGRAVKDHACDF